MLRSKLPNELIHFTPFCHLNKLFTYGLFMQFSCYGSQQTDPQTEDDFGGKPAAANLDLGSKRRDSRNIDALRISNQQYSGRLQLNSAKPKPASISSGKIIQPSKKQFQGGLQSGGAAQSNQKISGKDSSNGEKKMKSKDKAAKNASQKLIKENPKLKNHNKRSGNKNIMEIKKIEPNQSVIITVKSSDDNVIEEE